MDDLAARIEALTDEECLSLTGPWEVFLVSLRSRVWNPATGETGPLVGHIAAHEERDRRNAAHVRERLRGLMGRG